jgi:hypothetical protein
MLPLTTMSRRIELSASMQFAKVPVWGQPPPAVRSSEARQFLVAASGLWSPQPEFRWAALQRNDATLHHSNRGLPHPCAFARACHERVERLEREAACTEKDHPYRRRPSTHFRLPTFAILGGAALQRCDKAATSATGLQQPCHPERSPPMREANRSAKSKDLLSCE